MIEFACKSVVAGWQSCFAGTDITFGPTFHKIQDLWEWQKINLSFTTH